MGAPASVPYAFPDVPDLVLEPMTDAHLDEAAQLMVDAKIRTPCDGDHSGWGVLGPLPPCAGPLSHIRDHFAQEALAPAATWAVALTFQGRPLQYEVIDLDPAAPTTAEVVLTLRASRERPAWFWREVERPVFEALAAAGVEQAQVWIPPGLTMRWRTWLEEHFGAAYTGQWRSGGARCWGMPVDLSRFTGWPERKTVGFDVTVGRLRVWEATDAELPAARALIDRTVPIARKPLALRMVEEWWHLDRATFLLGARDGELRYLRAIRPRAGTVAGFAILTGVFDEPEQRTMGEQVLGWCKAAGYTSVTAFIQTAALKAGGVPPLMAASDVRVVAQHRRFREPFTEIEIPVPA